MVGKKILIVDDDKSTCKLLESALQQNTFSTYSVFTGEDALNQLKINHYDAVILDILLPGIDGLETLKQIKTNSYLQNIPVIMLTNKTSEVDSVVGLEIGADDYLGKPIRYYELIARVRSILRRTEKDQQVSSRKIVVKTLEIDTITRSVLYKGNAVTLSYKEYELLLLLAKFPGKVFSREEILTSVWQEEYSFETRTVDVHIRRLRSKFENIGDEPNIKIETIRNVGYRLTAL